jgi:2-oxoglutarate ferredoxin oxidoreductase subunit gamma
MSRHRLIFAGAGGQGVITAAIILAEAAVHFEGQNAVQSQSYGAAARGGISRSDVILSDAPIHFPKVTQPNTLICLTQEAYNSFNTIIRPGGILIADTRHVTLQTRAEARIFYLPLYDTVVREIGNPVVFNICLLGALQALTGLVRLDSLQQTVAQRVPSQYLEMNEKALQLGAQLGEQAEVQTL